MNKYWFRKRRGLKSKDLGWGWVPISWEGWLILISMVASIVISAFIFLGENIASDTDPTPANILLFLGVVAVLVGGVILISVKKARP